MNSLYFKNVSFLKSFNSIQKNIKINLSIYSNICDWKRDANFVQNIIKNVVYIDKCFIAISKPWGLPIHTSKLTESNLNKNQEEFLNNKKSHKYFNQSDVCLDDILPYLASSCRVQKLYVAKASHRFWSGVTLLTSSDTAVQQTKKALLRAKSDGLPYLRFFCITSGIPVQEKGEERCGIEQFELDEFGDYKEAIYIPPDKIVGARKKKIKHRDTKDFKVGNVRWKTLASNRELSVSLVELETNITKWSFIECFLAYKASFVLGDQVYSRRINKLMGVPVLNHPQKAQTVEQIIAHSRSPVELSPKLKKALKIHNYTDLPLMIHLAGTTFSGLKRSVRSLKCDRITPTFEWNEDSNGPQNNDDIVIDASSIKFMPPYFVGTLDALGLNIFK